MFRTQLRVVARLAVLAAAIAPISASAQRPGGFQPPPGVDSTRFVRTTAPTDPVIQQMWVEGMERGRAMELAQVLLDSIGPRLNNTDLFSNGQDWLVREYTKWGIPATRDQYGTWVKWVRGPTYMDLLSPRLRTLEATMLGWSPGTDGKWVEAEVTLIPPKTTPEAFAQWRESARGKFVLGSALNPTCRAPAQMREFGEPATLARIDSTRQANNADYADRFLQGGNRYEWPAAAGVAGVLTTTWSNYPGINKIFGTPKQQVPTLDVSCEDYSLLYRLAENNQSPRIRLFAQSQNLGEQPVHNVIGRIEGSTKADEYIILSAHYDSWDGGSGATDNGTGTITMMEAMRILKKVYPNPKRTIIVGHWGGEEQGLNGSAAWVADNPEIVTKVHAGFNQDNGTGRIVSVSPGPFVAGTDALARYMFELPASMTGRIRLSQASNGPGRGGTDSSSFQCVQSPVFGTSGLSWDYGSTTWHTNRDTYDKVIAEDLQNNATLIAMLVYMADQDAELMPREVNNPRNREGVEQPWPTDCSTGDRNTAASPR